MCGLYSLESSDELIRRYFPDDWEWSESADLYVPSRTIGPSAKKPGSKSNHRLVALSDGNIVRFGTMRWRFEKVWLREKKAPIHPNAKIEGMFTNGMFSHSAKNRRCLVIVDGFYEPKGPKLPRGQKRDQYFFAFSDGRPFALGGIYAHYKAEDDDFFGFSIVTTNPGAEVSEIHPRSPVILDTPNERDSWLAGSEDDVELFKEAIDRPGLVAQKVEGLYGRR